MFDTGNESKRFSTERRILQNHWGKRAVTPKPTTKNRKSIYWSHLLSFSVFLPLSSPWLLICFLPHPSHTFYPPPDSRPPLSPPRYHILKLFIVLCHLHLHHLLSIYIIYSVSTPPSLCLRTLAFSVDGRKTWISIVAEPWSPHTHGDHYSRLLFPWHPGGCLSVGREPGGLTSIRTSKTQGVTTGT